MSLSKNRMLPILLTILLIITAGAYLSIQRSTTHVTTSEAQANPNVGNVFVPLTQTRVYSTSWPAGSGVTVGPLAASSGYTPSVRIVNVAHGRNSSTGVKTITDMVPAGATAVSYTVTSTGTAGNGALNITSAAATNMGMAHLFYYANRAYNTASSVSKIDASRNIQLWNIGPAVNATIDITGYYVAQNLAGNVLTPTDPSRIYDSAWTTGANGANGTKVGNVWKTLAVKTRYDSAGGSPNVYIPTATNVTAVAYTLTTTASTAPGAVFVYKDATTPLDVPSVYFATGLTKTVASVAPVNPNGTIALYIMGSATHVSVTINGYYTAKNSTGSVFVPIDDTRMYNTKQTLPDHRTFSYTTARTVYVGDGRDPATTASGAVADTGAGVVPGGATAVQYNLTTADDATVSGNTIVTSAGNTCGVACMVASAPYVVGAYSANSAISAVDSSRRMWLWGLNGQFNATLDVSGYFVPYTTVAPATSGLSPESYPGCSGSDTADDTAALNDTISRLGDNGTLYLAPEKTYYHSSVIAVNRPNLHIRISGGGKLVGTNPAAASVWLMSSNISVDNVTFETLNVTGRLDAYENHGIVVGNTQNSARPGGISLTDVTVTDAPAAGVYVKTDGFTLTRVTVNNSRADGIHMTEAASNGTVTDAVVNGAGDDGVSVVSYRPGPGYTDYEIGKCHDIAINNPKVTGNAARGVSTIGGNNIVWRNVDVTNSYMGGIFIGSEDGSWHTTATTNVTVEGAKLTGVNVGAPQDDHGAVLLSNGLAPATGVDTSNHHLALYNLTIKNTDPGVSRQVGVLSGNGSVHDYITLGEVSVWNIVPNAPTNPVLLSFGNLANGFTVPAHHGETNWSEDGAYTTTLLN